MRGLSVQVGVNQFHFNLMAKLADLCASLPNGWEARAEKESARAIKQARVHARHLRKQAGRAVRARMEEARLAEIAGSRYLLAMEDVRRLGRRGLQQELAGRACRKKPRVSHDDGMGTYVGLVGTCVCHKRK